MLTTANFLAVALGGMVGSVLRWLMSVWLNPAIPGLAVGTLGVNVIGGFVIGFAVAGFLQHPAISSEWRLLVVTGFCGGFTTFSAFTSEVVWLVIEGRLAWALATVGANLVGAIAATYAGVKVFQASGL